MKTFKQHVLTEAFTKQHYTAIAKTIHNAYVVAEAGGNAEDAIDDIAKNLAIIFANDNPRFDKGFFLNACGV